MSAKSGRNEPCPCGSGKNLRDCCKNFESAIKVLQLNIIFREKLIDDVLRDPKSFAHKLRGVAFHEAGHALMEMLFYRDLKQVSIMPNIYSLEGIDGMKIWAGVCIGIDHDWKPSDEDAGVHTVEQAAIISAGEIAAALFCTCDTCKRNRADSEEDGDEKRFIALAAKVTDEHKKLLLSATNAAIQRHRPQLDAIVEALIEHKTLSNEGVFAAMMASGWNPDTDVDPEQFFNEALGICAATQGV